MFYQAWDGAVLFQYHMNGRDGIRYVQTMWEHGIELQNDIRMSYEAPV